MVKKSADQKSEQDPAPDEVHLETREQWRAWLVTHHGASRGVWLVSWKATTGRPRFSYDAAVEEALCVGWIDSIQRGIDDDRTKQWFTPRKAKSAWSRSNKERVARLTASGLMLQAGLKAVAAAQANGEWTRSRPSRT